MPRSNHNCDRAPEDKNSVGLFLHRAALGRNRPRNQIQSQQTRPVTTVKLIIENSIEARLLEVQKKKTALANMTLGQNFSKAEMLRRRMEELNQLFGS